MAGPEVGGEGEDRQGLGDGSEKTLDQRGKGTAPGPAGPRVWCWRESLDFTLRTPRVADQICT